MLSLLLLAALGAPAPQTSARWRCQPAEVALGEPFALVLELEHPSVYSGGELAAGELTLDESWVVLSEAPAESTVLPDGRAATRRTWRVASLEPGERSLSDALSGFALSGAVERIQVGDAHVGVRGVLAEGEDAPRPMREFPEGFAGEGRAEGASGWIVWTLTGVLLAGTLASVVVWRRLRRRAVASVRVTPLERLGELERELEGERARAGCFELTRLLREAADGARQRSRAGLTDEEWLAELSASAELPREAVSELGAVFERAGRVKYAGEPATPWALQETFARARSALAAVTGSGVRQGRASA